MDTSTLQHLVALAVGQNEDLVAGKQPEARSKHSEIHGTVQKSDVTIGLPPLPPQEDGGELFWGQEADRVCELRDADVASIRSRERAATRELWRAVRTGLPRQETAVSSALRARIRELTAPEAEDLTIRAQKSVDIDLFFRERTQQRTVRRKVERLHSRFLDEENRSRWAYGRRLREINASRENSRASSSVELRSRT